MDRQIVYPGQILPETTLLQMTKDAMIGLAKLSAAVLGTATAVNGFAVTPTSPASLQVYAAPGEIYSLQNIDGTAFSSLAADTTHQILKQGISLDQVTLSCPAPATAGQSINYLIEASYADTDSNPVLLPYYNSASPNTPFSGQGNNGLTQNTARKGTVTLTAKAGVPATTGSQTTPAPDSGYVGLYVVTVANGQTQITAGNISPYAAAPFINMVNMAQIQAQTGTAFAAGGAAPNFTLTPSPAITAYAAGQRFRVAFGANGTTGSNTLNWNGLGAKSLMQYGPGGVLVPAVITTGLLSDVEYNGTYMVVLDPVSAGISSSGVTLITATGTLPASVAGGTVIGNTASATTQTLPAANSMPAGTKIEFWNYAAGVMTIIRAGADSILMPAVANSLSLGQGDSLVLETNGSNAWYAISGSAQISFSNVGASNLSTGWKRYPDANSPNGYITEQWGISGSVAAGGSVSVTFPIAFTNAILSSVATPVGASVNSNPGGLGVARSLTGLTIYNWGGSIAYSSGVYWNVKGY